MNRCAHRGHYYHDDGHRDGRRRNRPHGVIRRVTQGLADRFGIPRKVIFIAFIVGLIINAPLTIFIFLLALYWVTHPGSIEAKLNRFAGWLGGLGHRGSERAQARRAAEAATDTDFDPDAEFSSLRRQFEDLERRAADMEDHVASDEYDLNRELGKMRRGEDGGESKN